MVKLGFVKYGLSVLLLTNLMTNVLSTNHMLAQFWIRCCVQQTFYFVEGV